MIDTGPSATLLLEGLNARTLSPLQIAQSFVPPQHFDRLISQQHTLLLGQRGSGKTTLQKMLTPQALDKWDHSRSEHFRSAVAFIGVFIPTDTSWWLDSSASELDSNSQNPELSLCVLAAFTTHVIRSLLESFEYLASTPDSFARAHATTFEFTRGSESDLVSDLSSIWQLKPRLLSLMSLKYAIDLRQSEIESYTYEYLDSLRRQQATMQGPPPSYVFSDFLTMAGSAIRIFSDKIPLARRHWALCFDELELAPKKVMDTLLRRLRSTEQSILFKLSLSPYSNIRIDTGASTPAQPKHDYDVIPLWYARKEDNYAFSRSLASALVKSKGVGVEDIDKLLGESVFEFDTEESTTLPYAPGSRQQQAFQRLAAKDPSFKDYLSKNQIDPDNPGLVMGTERASDVRKIVGLVTVRDAFLAPNWPGTKADPKATLQRRRSRKNPQIYFGATALYAVCEGNPRWLKAVITELLRTPPRRSTIDAASQSRVVSTVANVFRALLKTIPVPETKGVSARGLLGVLDDIGDYFFRNAIIEPFKSEPFLTFTVDSHMPESSMEVIGRALNAGAIIYVPDSDDVFLMGSQKAFTQSLRGKRFRIAYLLAAHYRLPLMLGKKISLRQILSGTRSEALTQPTLFDLGSEE